MSRAEESWVSNTSLSPWLQRELQTAHGAHRAWVIAALDQSAEIARLRVELDTLRQDARRYRWLVQENSDAVACIAWRYRSACKYGDPDQAIDAAMAQEAQGGTP